ncbi:MAG: glycosyltransferase [Candidatus Brocadiaceae bacterium]|nr:glycosyltransferase [Candidatus Brocadiaceae bacterium]
MKVRHLPYQIAIIITLGVYLYYLIYRIRYTINPESLILSLSFFYAEAHGFLALFLFFFQIWQPAQRKAPPPNFGLTVDVYIPTYNEDISILRKTALGCVNMRYPHTTYILDDGNRPELAKIAESWGCKYITRKERKDAKAGNLNNALRNTNADYIVIFDADFVPQPNFLDKTIGYFRDPKVAFVQTPHNYYNVDSFQFRINKKKEQFWNEQDIFYKLMMPCRDYWNSTFFTGSAAVFRRQALEDIGGIATGNITEDINTTILLYSRGWKGIYHNEVLSNGLAAKDLKNYHTQLLRWAEGNIGLLFVNNPLFIKGLTFSQRVCFFAVIFGWLIGFPKLIYFILPPIMLLSGGYPIGSFDFCFIWRYAMFLGVILIGFKFACRGYGKIRYDESYLMMNFFIFIKAALKNILRIRSVFKVTGKGLQASANLVEIIPQSLVCLICFGGIAWGWLKLYYGVSPDFMGIGVAIFWSFVNGFLAISGIELVTRPYFKRKEFRFVGAIPVRYSIPSVSDSISNVGVSRDLNEHGISLVTFSPLPMDKKISLSLYLNENVLSCNATALYTAHDDTMPSYLHNKMFIYGLKFEGLSRDEMDLISRYCFDTIIPRFLQRFGKKSSVFLKIFYKFCNHERFRKHVRKKITIPLVIYNKGKPFLTAVTNDISVVGLSFTSYMPLELGMILIMEIFTPFGKCFVKGEIKQMREIVAENSYFVGIKFSHFFSNQEYACSMPARKDDKESLERWLKIVATGNN